MRYCKIDSVRGRKPISFVSPYLKYGLMRSPVIRAQLVVPALVQQVLEKDPSSLSSYDPPSDAASFMSRSHRMMFIFHLSDSHNPTSAELGFVASNALERVLLTLDTTKIETHSPTGIQSKTSWLALRMITKSGRQHSIIFKCNRVPWEDL